MDNVHKVHLYLNLLVLVNYLMDSAVGPRNVRSHKGIVVRLIYP